MSNPKTINLCFTGNYSLETSVTLASTAAFVDNLYDGLTGRVLDSALLPESSWKTVGMRIAQQNGAVCAHMFANPDNAATEAIRANLERILSLNIDGSGVAEVAARDTVFASLWARSPGVRPVLFPSLYEAAARAIAINFPFGRPQPHLFTLEAIADRWRPYQSWIGLMLRNSIPR